MPNKLRLIRIYELRGLVHPIEQSVIDILDDIEEITYDDYIDYKKKCFRYFTYYLNNNEILLFPHTYKLFKYSNEETRVIMKYLLEKHLKIEINTML